jgi:YVTN family beta-propeller protein
LGLTVDEKGERAYVALHTAGTLAVVDLRTGKVLHEIAVGAGPSAVVLGKDTAWVACEADDSLVAVDPARAAVRRRVPIGQSPRDLVVTPDGSRVYVACHDEGLYCYQVASGKVEKEFARYGLERVLLAPDAREIYLLAPNGPEGSTLFRQSLGGGLRLTSPLSGRSNARGLAVLARQDSRFEFVVHQRPRNHVPTTQVAQGWVFTNAVTLGISENPRAILDEPNRGYADPSDVVTDGRRVFVACAGADHVVVLDTQKLLDYAGIGRWTGWEVLFNDKKYPASDDLTASRKYVTARIPTQANPRRLTLSGDGKTLVVSNHLADSLTVIDTASLKVVRTISLGGPEPDTARRGEVLFNSGTMTFQGQFTCASCHPDGGADGLNWDLTRDGVGNFKNTRSLLGVKETAPYGWHGSSPTLADRVAGTLRTLHRHEPAGTEVDDIVAYLETLPPPRPLPQKEADKPAIARGRELFQGKGRCSTCHYRAGLDDGKQHDVGTRGPTDTQDRFDTPALWGVARTAPYLHDGRAATLEEVFTKYDGEHRHGAAHTLSKEELADLIAYLKSL